MDVNVEDYVTAPTDAACALSAGLLAACAGLCGVAAFEGGYALCAVVLASPFFVGALVGALAYRRPVRAAFAVVFAAVALWFSCCASFGPDWVAYAFGIPTLFAFVAPPAALGAVCAATVRRWLRGRSAHASRAAWGGRL